MGRLEERDRRLPWHRKDRRPRGYRPGPFALIYAGLLAAGLVAAAVVYVVLVHDVPGMRANRADTLKTALLVIGGSGALAGLYVAYRKQRTDEANHLRDQDKLFTERYTAAAAQLGNPAAAVRLAGVYALARIADDSERDRPTCLKVLCAYLRMPYNPDDPKFELAERQVRATAQTAIGERLRADHPGFWPGARIDLTDAYLTDLDFNGITVGTFKADHATFSGNTGFHTATFGGNAEFFGATFSADSSFVTATFGGLARFSEATFSGGTVFNQASFRGNAEFDGATFSKDAWFDEVLFAKDAGFNGARFVADARFKEVRVGGDAGFESVTVGRVAWFDKARFAVDAWFSEATFSGNGWFGGATFNGGADFGNTTFSGNAEFGKATFSGYVHFGEARFRRDRQPVWPQGFAEPGEIVWFDPPPPDATGSAAASVSDLDLPVGPSTGP